jgi:hypothetical protein
MFVPVTTWPTETPVIAAAAIIWFGAILSTAVVVKEVAPTVITVLAGTVAIIGNDKVTLVLLTTETTVVPGAIPVPETFIPGATVPVVAVNNTVPVVVVSDADDKNDVLAALEGRKLLRKA